MRAVAQTVVERLQDQILFDFRDGLADAGQACKRLFERGAV